LRTELTPAHLPRTLQYTPSIQLSRGPLRLFLVMMPIRTTHPAPTSRSNRLRWSLTAFILFLASATLLQAQDWIHLTASTDNNRLRIAVANFKPTSNDPSTGEYKHTFDTVLYSDLVNAGVFDIVSKDMLPQSTPGFPAEINLTQWSSTPANAAMVTFGNLAVQNDRIIVNGFLDDTHNTQYPQVFAKQYNEQASDDMARQIAHRFADEIIFRLGGGMAGIAETKIYYVKTEGPNKEIWEMDYDGANQHQLTHLGEISLSPRISPDNSRIAFSSLGSRGWSIKMYSLLLNRLVRYPIGAGGDISPAWSPSGQQLAFASSRSGNYQIWISDSDGNLSHKVTSFPNGNSSPTWDPKTGAQIAWISGRSGLPQLYTMDVDGSGVTRLTDGGYASSPSWSPNGQFIAFAWDRKYGPGAPGGQDIYVMEIATKKWIQLTHDEGRCDFPSWSPDGRHIVYSNSPDGRAAHTRIMSMLADGTQNHELAGPGADMPNWSWK
jgi:TolB protein